FDEFLEKETDAELFLQVKATFFEALQLRTHCGVCHTLICKRSKNVSCSHQSHLTIFTEKISHNRIGIKTFDKINKISRDSGFPHAGSASNPQGLFHDITLSAMPSTQLTQITNPLQCTRRSLFSCGT